MEEYSLVAATPDGWLTSPQSLVPMKPWPTKRTGTVAR
jgi:hypothetical protein